MTEDMQEALSSRYAAQCRLLVLSSGRWAIWFRDEPPVIVDSIDPEGLKRLVLGAQALDDLEREERRRTPTNQTVEGGTLEDMGL